MSRSQHIIFSDSLSQVLSVCGQLGSFITSPARIHIVGGPGSGKSTLARRLAAHLAAPVFELDTIAFTRPEFVFRDLQDRLEDTSEIAAQPRWITEGMWLGWTTMLFEKADIIIWLDGLPWITAAWRILVRQIRGALTEMRRQRGLRKFTRFRDYVRNLRLLVLTLWSSRAYYGQSQSVMPELIVTAESREATELQLLPYRHKVVRCRHGRDVETLIQSILQHAPLGEM